MFSPPPNEVATLPFLTSSRRLSLGSRWSLSSRLTRGFGRSLSNHNLSNRSVCLLLMMLLSIIGFQTSASARVWRFQVGAYGVKGADQRVKNGVSQPSGETPFGNPNTPLAGYYSHSFFVVTGTDGFPGPNSYARVYIKYKCFLLCEWVQLGPAVPVPDTISVIYEVITTPTSASSGKNIYTYRTGGKKKLRIDLPEFMVESAAANSTVVATAYVTNIKTDNRSVQINSSSFFDSAGKTIARKARSGLSTGAKLMEL